MQTFLRDVRYGMRMLGRNPGFTLIAILTLALGIGANTAIFSVVNAELLRPLPFRDPGRIVRVWGTSSRVGAKSNAISYPDFADWRAQNRVFEKMAAYTNSTNTLTEIAEPAHLESVIVSAETFELLGVAPQLGRWFEPKEDEGHHHVVMLSDRLWKQRFGGDPGIIGRAITLDGSAYTVVGVMPAGFQFPLQRQPAALWTTFSATQESPDSSPAITTIRGAHFMLAIARLKPGVSIPQAQAEMDVIASALEKQYPDSDKYTGIRLLPEQDEITEPIRPALFMLLVAVGLVLLIACVNVANLLLARATSRMREIAIRTALGAGRARVVRQLLTESLLLALVAGILGVVLASWGSDLLVRLSPDDLPRAAEIHLDGRVLGFTTFLALLTGFLFGLVPSLQVTRASIVDTLKESALSTTASGHRHRLRSSLVIVEMALALVLLVSAGLLIRSLVRLRDVNPGFDARNVMTSTLDLPDQTYPNPKKTQLMRDLISRLKVLPGVESVAGIEPLPMSGAEFRTSVEIEGRPVAKSEEVHSSVRVITPDYFRAMKIPFLQGREFTEQDGMDTTQVVIVNEALARQFFPAKTPSGNTSSRAFPRTRNRPACAKSSALWAT